MPDIGLITTGDPSMLHNSFRRYFPLAAALLVGLTLAGAPAAAQTAPGSGYSSQAEAQAASERGYHALLTVPLETPVITEQQYLDLWQYWPEPERSQAAAATPEQRRQMMLDPSMLHNSFRRHYPVA